MIYTVKGESERWRKARDLRRDRRRDRGKMKLLQRQKAGKNEESSDKPESESPIG